MYKSLIEDLRPNLNNLPKLFSKEDHFGPIHHVHKILGIIVLIQFAMRFLCNEFILTLPFSVQIFLSTLPLILSYSSLIFKVPRNRSSLYIIYTELQLHNIIFVTRSYLIYLFADYQIWVRFLLVFLCHQAADYVTRNYAPDNRESTVWRTVKNENGERKYNRQFAWYDHYARYFLSISQLAAIYVLIFDRSNPAHMAILIMFPIQISTFLATLVRKGVIVQHSQLSGLLYFLSLIPSYTYKVWSIFDLACLCLVILLRFRTSINKYLLWFSIFLLHSLFV